MQWIVSSVRAQLFGVIAKEFSNVTYCGYLAYFPGDARTATGVIFDFIVIDCIPLLTGELLALYLRNRSHNSVFRFDLGVNMRMRREDKIPPRSLCN